MKIAVFSDTHSFITPMLQAIAKFSPDAICHLGDHDRDTAVLLRQFPDIPIYRVSGNCDFTPLAPYRLVVHFGSIKAFLTHGHLYHVDFGHIDSLVYAAQEADAKLVLFGHTHTPMHTDVGGIKLVNPGTAGKGKDLSWAMVEIFDNGGIGVEFHYL